MRENGDIRCRYKNWWVTQLGYLVNKDIRKIWIGKISSIFFSTLERMIHPRKATTHNTKKKTKTNIDNKLIKENMQVLISSSLFMIKLLTCWVIESGYWCCQLAKWRWRKILKNKKRRRKKKEKKVKLNGT